ncbi:hypothetical protein JXA40_06305 [bacterium]|nr:hypothetical protein [candidate division CSSED10-310 bacterium]
MKHLIVAVIVFGCCAGSAGWQAIDTGVTAHLTGLDILDDENVWVAGVDGMVLHYDGTGWNIMDTGIENNLNDIDMLSSEEGWVVGDEGLILHYHDGIWDPVPDLEQQTSYEDLLAFDAENVYFVGYGIFPGGMILHWDGTEMTEVYQNTAANMADMAALGPQDIWVVGGDGFRLHYDGAAWTQDTAPLAESTKLFCVCFDEDGAPVIGGMRLPGWDLVKIYKKSGTDWNTEYTDYAPWMFDLAIHETVGFFVGKEGQMIEKTIFGWHKISAVTTRQINEINLIDMSRGWAVCDGGIVLRYEQPAIDITLSDLDLLAGDFCEVNAVLMNPGSEIDVSVFVILEAYGLFFFYPSFATDTDFMERTLPENSFETMTVLPEFAWPSGAGSGEATFWGALLDNTGLLGYDTEYFTWN